MASLVSWKRLVRYLSEDGHIRYGEPVLDDGIDLLRTAQAGKLKVRVAEGAISALTAVPSTTVENVKELLSPLSPSEVPFIRCIGLNYKTHILETGRSLPVCPTVFCKPATTIAGPGDTIPIPIIAQAKGDYEGELVIVIGRDAKNVDENRALEYVACYTVANDISARDWQRDIEKAGPVPQWSFSKSFDKYAPIGPCLVSREVLQAADNLELSTTVNGKIRQQTNTSDLWFNVAKLIAFCSQGQTLQAGSIILTGTPGGVGLFMSPPQFLQPGDEVAVEISGIGRIVNKISFE